MSKLDFREFRSDRKFGLELEVGPEISQQEIAETISVLNPESRVVVTKAWRQTDYNNEDWQVKQDSTCGPLAHLGKKSYGWEIVPKVSRFSDFPQIARTMDVLRLKGVEANANCGLHVHVFAGDLGERDVAAFMSWWVKCEWVIGNMVPPRRVINKYCQLYQHSYTLEDIHPSLRDFWDEIKPEDFSVHDNAERRFAINLVNYCAFIDGLGSSRKLPTLELRLPEGTMYSDDAKGWVLLFLSMVDRFPTLRMPYDFSAVCLEDFLWAIGLVAPPQDFYILDDNLYFLKKWIYSRLSMFSRNDMLRRQATFMYNYITELPSRRLLEA